MPKKNLIIAAIAAILAATIAITAPASSTAEPAIGADRQWCC